MVSFITHASTHRILGAAVRSTSFSTSTLTKAVASRSLPKAGYSNSLEYVPPFFHKRSSDSYKLDMFPVLIGIIVARSEDAKAGLREKMQALQDEIDAKANEILVTQAEWGRSLKRYREWLKKNPPINHSEAAFIAEHERKMKVIQDFNQLPVATQVALTFRATPQGKAFSQCRLSVDAEKPRYQLLKARWRSHQNNSEFSKQLALAQKISGLNNQLTPLLQESSNLELAIYGNGGFFQGKIGPAFGIAVRDLSLVLSVTIPWAAPSIATTLTIVRILRAAVEGDVIGQPSRHVVWHFLNLLQPSLSRAAVNSVIKDQLVSTVLTNRLNAAIDVLTMLSKKG